MRVDIHNLQKQLNRRLELIDSSSSILPENKAIISKFYHNCIAEGLTIARMSKLLQHLHYIAPLLNKPFIACEKQDIEMLLEKIETRDYSDWTKHDYKVVLKKFFKWLRGSDDVPPEVKWIRTNNIRRKIPEILTEDEVKRLAEAAENPRDKAFVEILYDAGRRIGEILPCTTDFLLATSTST